MFGLILALGLSALGMSAADAPRSFETWTGPVLLEKVPIKMAEPVVPNVLEYLRRTMPQRKDGTNVYWVCGGDLAIPDRDLARYAEQIVARMVSRPTVETTPMAPATPRERAAILNQHSLKILASKNELFSTGLTDSRGRPIRWQSKTEVTFCVDRASFKERYGLVKSMLANATTDWNSVSIPIRFRYVSEFDASPPTDQWGQPDGYDFVVVAREQPMVPAGAMALAFLPNADPIARRLEVYPLLFTQTQYDPVGVFRHEFGHVLGLIHEHNRTEGCSPDVFHVGESLLNLTATTDTESVMHYLCGGHGDSRWLITRQDVLGVNVLYSSSMASRLPDR
jgi:hypothetical protein